MLKGCYSAPSDDKNSKTVTIFLECDSVDEAMNVMAEFPLAKAGLLSFECIPLGSFINWENLFAAEFKNKE